MIVEQIFQKPFVKWMNEKGEAFIVGGAVRDMFMEKPSKDIDFMVRLIPYTELVEGLKKFGQVDLVGESFGVIKFKDSDGEVYDIALPRSDTKNKDAKGHKSIDSQSDHMMELEKDLSRRDFTINAIAIDQNGQHIDPFDGLEDMRMGLINAVSSDTFVDDPLRMMRALQFAARFAMDIESNTLELIERNVHLIKEITPERMLMEFDKVFEKNGDIQYFANLLYFTGIFETYFERKLKLDRLDYVSRFSEFLHYGIADTQICTAEFFKEKLKITNDTYRELQAFDIVYRSILAFDNRHTIFHVMFDALKKSEVVLSSEYIGNAFKDPFISGLYPKSMKELALTGEDFISLGFEGIAIGKAQKECLDKIFNNELTNQKEQLISFLKK